MPLVADGPADVGHALRQAVVGDVDVAPDGGDQLVLLHYFALPRGKAAQHPYGLRTQWDGRPAAVEQQAARLVQDCVSQIHERTGLSGDRPGEGPISCILQRSFRTERPIRRSLLLPPQRGDPLKPGPAQSHRLSLTRGAAASLPRGCPAAKRQRWPRLGPWAQPEDDHDQHTSDSRFHLVLAAAGRPHRGLPLLTALALIGTGAAAAAEPVTRKAEANGITMSYIEEGEGEPVVFVHGAVADVEKIREEAADHPL